MLYHVAMDLDSQLLKGVLTPLLLSLLEGRESYGYQLVTEIREAGLDAFPEGSIYPALGRLERQGYIASRLEVSDKGPARKYYSTTPEGAKLLREKRSAWQALVRAVEPHLGPSLPADGSRGGRADHAGNG
jgi:PadR family transcriptional regulator PadR